MEHNNAQFNFLRMTFKVLVPVSVFSFVISQYSSLILPLLLHSADEFSSSFSVNQLFRYSSERNYMFLLCNGILVFIIKNSGLIAMPPRSPDSQREKVLHISHETVSHKIYSREKATGKPKVVEVKSAEEEARKKGDESVIFIDHQEEEEETKKGYDESVIFTDHHNQEEEEERKKGDDEIVIYSDHHHEEEEEEGAEENEVGDDDEEGEEDRLIKEELKKKCDEFIKRMKQDIIMRK